MEPQSEVVLPVEPEAAPQDEILGVIEEELTPDPVIGEPISPDLHETFTIGGKEMVLSIDSDSIVSICLEEECHLVGQGSGSFEALKSLFGTFNADPS